MKRILSIGLTSSLLALLWACNSQPVQPLIPEVDLENTAAPEQPEAAATVAPTQTPAPTHTAVALTETPVPTETAIATADPFALITATPAVDLTEPFVPYGEVEQPPYAASDCSDKYPCNDDVAAWEARVRVPAGFTAAYFAHLESEQPTNMTFGPDGLLYVTTQSGKIMTVDESGHTAVYLEGLLAPTGIAFRPGTTQLYISSRVVEDNINGEAQVAVIEDGQITPLISGLPCCYAFMHGPHTIVFDSAGMGYVGVGAKADHGEVLTDGSQQAELQPYEAGIVRFSPDGSLVEKFADGLRNPYGLAIDSHDQLFANDNGPDFGPPDEFHRIVPGANHGYPWYNCDVCFPKPAEVDPLPPTYEYPAHSAPTGLVAYLAEQFPNGYNNLFGVLWSAFPEAQRVVRFGPDGEDVETFATGFAAPIAVAVGPEGSLYVADWATGIIFKISYTE